MALGSLASISVNSALLNMRVNLCSSLQALIWDPEPAYIRGQGPVLANDMGKQARDRKKKWEC